MKQVRRNSNYFLLFVFSILFPVCSERKMDEDILARIYVEKIVIEESHNSNASEMKKELDELFKKHKTTPAEFEKGLKIIGSKKENWEKFFNKANTILNELKKRGSIE